MTAAFLQVELSNLISESKRKHTEIKIAAEKSLSELKAIAVTSETQLSGDLNRRSNFVDPFLLACKSHNAKLASIGTAGLQRCVAAIAVPRSRISDVLEAYEEASPLALDVQLKILQTLPSLLQLYAADLHGQDTLGRALSISSDLSANKLPMVSKTAAATFQQLLTAVFARVPAISKAAGRNNDETPASAHDREDAFAVFTDLCTLIAGERASFARLDNLAPPTVLEVLETIISSHGYQLLRDPGVVKACQDLLLPGICTLINDSSNYGVVVRATRIAYLFALSHTSKLTDGIEQLLQTILKFADRPPMHRWKRLLSLEFFRGICSDFDALRTLFTTFDMHEGRPNIISSFMASLVRTASEDPALIGLGRQTTVPTSKNSDSGGEILGATEVPLSAVTQTSATARGISLEWSSVNTPCLESYDRSTPVDTPDTYVYTLVLSCVSAYADGLSKFVMPLSVPNRKTSKAEDVETELGASNDTQPKVLVKDVSSSSSPRFQQLVNPLISMTPTKREAVENCANMIENCWPAILAICSTFLNAALDSYYYHMLIRTVQKLTQVSGVLELFTPRDALLTTLAKVSLPANVTSLMNGLFGSRPALGTTQDLPHHDDLDTIKSPIVSTPRASVDISSQSLNVRNLLCLRALLNLGIALGPTLSQAAWLIILQSLEQVEALMSAGPNARLLQSNNSSGDTAVHGQAGNLTTELAAMDTARRRMIESTSTYSDAAFGIVCKALLQIVADITPSIDIRSQENGTSGPAIVSHGSMRSVSGNWAKGATLEVEVEFVLKTLGRVVSVNLHRFREAASSDVSWDLIVVHLTRLEMNDGLLPGLRLQCAKIIDAIAVEASTSDAEADEASQDVDCTIAIKYGIPALGSQLQMIQHNFVHSHSNNDLASKVVNMLLEALQNIIGSCGENLSNGWVGVFEIIRGVIDRLEDERSSHLDQTLYVQAFKPVQLVLSDFLSALDDGSLESLVGLLESFASQKFDLNMALTASALYWNIASLLISQNKSFEVDIKLDALTDDSSHNLWSQLMFRLYELSKDSQHDLRNAALRMLTRILHASVDKLDPTAMLSCLEHIWLSLISHYSQMLRLGNETWTTSISTILNDFQQIIEQYGHFLLRSPLFERFWCETIEVFEGLLEKKIIVLNTQIFYTLTSILSTLRSDTTASAFGSSNEAVRVLWLSWAKYHPADIQADLPNEAALSAYADLLIEIADWRFDYISGSDKFADQIARAIHRSTFSARHDQYTVDTKRLSISQGSNLHMIGLLQRIYAAHDRSVQELLVRLIGDIVTTTRHSQTSGLSTGRLKVPTNIAFASACIEILRREATRETCSDRQLDIESTLGALDLCIRVVKTKYSDLPTNPELPLWQSACSYGVECVNNLRDSLSGPSQRLVYDCDKLAKRLTDLTEAILLAPELETKVVAETNTPWLEKDETFDISRLKVLHATTIEIFHSLKISEPQLKRHILLLFRQSFVAQPWYNDLTKDLVDSPLASFTAIRRGSIRLPILPVRREVYKQSFHSLLDIVDSRHMHSSGHGSPSFNTMASLAAPYVLIRVAHTLKTFIADQPLRNLEQPVIALQHELQLVLRAFTRLKVADKAFEATARVLCGLTMPQESGIDEVTQREVSQMLRDDEKSHLRLLYSLAQKFEQVWYGIPRLDIRECSWQAQDDGQNVERCLREWKELISEGWGPRF